VWGGWQDAARSRPWQRDTLVNVYSVGKGVLGGLLMCVVEDGRLSVDDPVVKYWPEFAPHDKSAVSVRMLASHRAGLPALRERLGREHLYDWRGLCDRFAAERPWWVPGRAHGYHVNSFGFLVGEVIARATGLPVPEALEHYMTGPAEADFFYGVPESEHARCADMLVPGFELDTEEHWAMAFPPTGDRERDVMRWHTYFNPPGISGVPLANTAAWRSSVIPSTSGHATARAVASLYAGMIGSGVELATTPGARVLREATRGDVDGEDVILRRPSRFGIGFQLPIPTRPLGPSASAFGHYGYGGSLGFADPSNDLAFGYVMNRPGDRWQTPRTQRLIDAVYACLGAGG
jgi:CubicO group peptidase (beta-lactamase class C family)